MCGHVAPIAVSVVELMNRLLATLMDFSSSSHTTLAAMCVPYIVCIITKPHTSNFYLTGGIIVHGNRDHPLRLYVDMVTNYDTEFYELNKIIFAVQTPGIFNKSSYYFFMLYFN